MISLDAIMENSYSSLSVAIQALQAEGFTEDFNLCHAGVENKSRKTIHPPSELDVIRYYRFEGMSNPDDNTVLYVITTASGEKGLLVDAYGAYAGNIPNELLEKLIIH
jgi:hypothetical protein